MPNTKQNGLSNFWHELRNEASCGSPEAAPSGEAGDEMAAYRGAHIQIQGITHRYRSGRSNALEDINLEIQPEESVALIGRSGCGKSSLLHILAGLMRPTRGTVHIDGAAVSGPSPAWVMMFQQPSLLPWMTVAQNVALGLRFTGRMKDAATRVPEMLELVELGEFADRNVQDLSGGQQQRVALARSLAPDPQVLLLDEPFSALDSFTRAHLQRDVRRIAKDRGITLVLVTHDISEATLMADRAIVMASNPGRIRSEVRLTPDASDEAGSSARARAQLMNAYETAADMPTLVAPDASIVAMTRETPQLIRAQAQHRRA